jgi:8-oxo-dGTP diphosphatase
MKNRPSVGVAVIVIKNGKVLLGKRKGSHGSGSWAFPGGHLEMNESIEECSRREVIEETGISIKNIRYATFTNDIFKEEQKHYVTLFVVAEYSGGGLRVNEPDKCEKWDWFIWEKFPENLFLSLKNLLAQGFHIPNCYNSVGLE